MRVKETVCALIDAFSDLANRSGCSEWATMESLLDIFEPEELIALGYEERVTAYLDEYGTEDELSNQRKELPNEHHGAPADEGFELTAFLLNKVYANMDAEDVAHWSHEDAEDIAHDIKLSDDIDADADEIYETIAEFIQQDYPA